MPSIDERIEALTHSLELFRAEQEEFARRQQRLDERERSARLALLAGIHAYLEALDGEEGQ